MTLIDVDKNTDDRSSPMPLTHDVLIADSVMAKATQGNQYSVNAPPTGRINVTNQRIITNDGTTNRVLITPTQMLVSQQGVDVATGSASQMIFNSSQDVFKIASKVSITIPSFTIGTSRTNYAQITIPHGLPTTPLVNAYVSGALINFNNSQVLASTYIPLPVVASATTGANEYVFQSTTPGTYYPLTILYGVDATNVYIQASYGGTTVDTMAAIAGTLFLLQETAN